MNGGFDFSGIHAFWQIYDILKTDCEPSNEDWDKLFATPGYHTLVQSEFKRSFFISKFRLAYKPSLTKELNKTLITNKYGVLHHYLEVEQMRNELNKHQSRLKAKYLDDIVKLCLTWLPIDTIFNYPPVSYLIFANDARGYTPVVVDLLASLKLQDFIKVFLAHEFHHYYRRQYLNYNYEGAQPAQRKLLRVLDQIHCEGLADCIDKAILIAEKHPFVHGFEALVNQTPLYLQQLDTTFIALSKGAITWSEAGELLNSQLPQSGHPVGYYMAQAILASGMKDAMIEGVGDCFAFFTLYQQAVQDSTSQWYRFSAAGLDALAKLKEQLLLNISF